MTTLLPVDAHRLPRRRRVLGADRGALVQYMITAATAVLLLGPTLPILYQSFRFLSILQLVAVRGGLAIMVAFAHFHSDQCHVACSRQVEHRRFIVGAPQWTASASSYGRHGTLNF